MNTPLHLAAMRNNYAATFDLVTKYESSIDATNSDGIVAKDIGAWHPDIKKVFTDFFEGFDKTVMNISLNKNIQ